MLTGHTSAGHVNFVRVPIATLVDEMRVRSCGIAEGGCERLFSTEGCSWLHMRRRSALQHRWTALHSYSFVYVHTFGHSHEVSALSCECWPDSDNNCSTQPGQHCQGGCEQLEIGEA